MIQRFITIIALIALGFGLGWVSREWTSADSEVILAKNKLSTTIDNQAFENNSRFSIHHQSQDIQNLPIQPDVANNNDLPIKIAPSILVQFQALLNNYQYEDAVTFYQIQDQNNRNDVARLKQSLLNHLGSLLTQQQFNDFSSLVDLFLSSYYDDIDVLLLLADFNRINGLHIEAINIYQLANTYAYQHTQQEMLWSHFNRFVEITDNFYTAKEDWHFLSNFYTQIEVSGLITPSYQYRQALVNLHRGEQPLAIEQLEALKDDTTVGKQARNILQQLVGNTENIDTGKRSPWESEESIRLQQKGNQYLVDLRLNNQDKVTLLIDTGASMTTLSQDAFLALNSKRDAVKIAERVFNTANGVTKGTIYRFEQLTIGQYKMNNVPIAVLYFSMRTGVDGLLGMNTLGQFRFQIDQSNQRLLLSRKSSKN